MKKIKSTAKFNENAFSNLIFCGFCGTKWEGEHDWGYSRMAWIYQKNYQRDWAWAIQSRYVWKRSDGSYDPPSEWTTDQIFKGNALSAYDAIRQSKLNHRGDMSPIHFEFRALIIREPSEVARAYGPYGIHIDHRYFAEYQNRWGGKLHDHENMRSWYLPR